MRNARAVGWLCAAAVAAGGVAGRAWAGVEVFTVAGAPVTHAPAGAAVVELDKPARLDARLSRGLPAKPKAAAAAVRRRLRAFKPRYGRAYKGLVRAWELGVKRIPAVVVDGRYVVYGQPDVARALAAIKAARQSGQAAP